MEQQENLRKAFDGKAQMRIRHILYNLIRSPRFSLVTILTLAVGIGANAAIFSVVNAVLLRPLPYPESDRLVSVWHTGPNGRFPQSNGTFAYYLEKSESFASMGLASNPISINIRWRGEPLRVQAALASASLFSTFGIAPLHGPGFVPENERPGGRAVMLSQQLWANHLNSDLSLIGKTIEVNGFGMPVAGVVPDGFRYPGDQTELWLSHVVDPSALGRTVYMFPAVGRLKPGVSLEEANADLNRLTPQLPDAYPSHMTPDMVAEGRMRSLLVPLKDDVVGDVDQVLWVLLGTAGAILLIACANVANLYLVRAEERLREVAMRFALGAGRGRLIGYFLSESVLLAMFAGVIGLGMAEAGTRVLLALSPGTIPRLDEVAIDPSVLLFTAAASLLAGVLFGAIPCLRYSRPDLGNWLKEGGRSGDSRRRHRIRSVLAACQVALALTLLVAGGLMVQSVRQLRGVNPGFQPQGALTIGLALNRATYRTAADVARFYQRVLEEVRALPGVASVGAVNFLPLTDTKSNIVFLRQDTPLQKGESPPSIRSKVATDGYFEAIGIPLIRGRTLKPRDHEENTGAVVVSAALAERFWPGQDPLGKRVSPTVSVQDDRWYTIVGVVGDVHDDSLDSQSVEIAYYAMVNPSQNTGVPSSMSLVIRTQGDPESLAPSVRRQIWSLDAQVPLFNVSALGQIVSRSMARTAFAMFLLGIAAAAALLLGTVGIYGLVSYMVSQRVREIAVRMALGAQKSSISRMVVRQGILVAAAGIAAGLAGSLALSRFLQTLLYGVSRTDLLTYCAVALLLLAVTVLASYLPARRAAGIDPIIALRTE